MIAVDILVIWALTVHGDELQEQRRRTPPMEILATAQLARRPCGHAVSTREARALAGKAREPRRRVPATGTGSRLPTAATRSRS